MSKFFAKFPYTILCIVLAAGRKKGALQFLVVSKKEEKLFSAFCYVLSLLRVQIYAFPFSSTVDSLNFFGEFSFHMPALLLYLLICTLTL